VASSSDVLATIPVGMEPRLVALTPDGGRAYVTLEEFRPDGVVGAVAVIDTATNSLVATIPLHHACGVVVAPDGHTVYVPVFDSSQGKGIVSVIDAGTNTVVDGVVVSGPGGGPKGVAIAPDGRRVYVATDHEVASPEAQGKVSVIETDSKAVIASFRIHPFPGAAAITPDGRSVYVLDTEGDPAVIDTTTHQITFPHGGTILDGRMAFTPDGLRAFVVSEGSDFVEVLDVASHTTVTVVDVFGGTSTDVAVTPDGRRVYVTQRPGHSSSQRRILAIDTATQKLVGAPLEWSGSADGLAITPDGLIAYVSDRSSRAVRVVRLSTA
jgi:DNA-binding beta-propeller fold protein YncE